MRSTIAVSEFNRKGIEESSIFSAPPAIVDCTLRDGEQQAGVVLSADEKVALAGAIARLGVYELELGTPAVSEDDRHAIAAIVSASLGVRTSALARATRSDIALVESCGVDGVRISAPISTRQRAAKVTLNDAEYVQSALEICSYAKERGLEVIFSPYDTTRCEETLLRSLLSAFAKHGCVDRIRLVDTTGAGTPEAIAYLVRLMLDEGSGIPIEVHCHNDLGLATANTIAGALAGARYLSVTMNGIGERAGNAALEEVATALYVLYGVDVGVQLGDVMDVSGRVAAASRVSLQPHKAVVGSNAFAHETGMVVAGVLKDPFTAECYSPTIVGQERVILVGKKSGRATIRAKLASIGMQATEAQIQDLLVRVKDTASEMHRALYDHEFALVAEEVITRRQRPSEGDVPCSVDLAARPEGSFGDIKR